MMPPTLHTAFLDQSEVCGALGSEFMNQLMRLCAERDWPEGGVKDRVFGWKGDVRSSADSLPLRLAGALHALGLQGNTRLTAVYPPNTAADDALWSAVSDALISDCLLYTSPSPRDGATSRMPSSA